MRENRSPGVTQDRSPTFYSVAETAGILRMSEMTLYRAINADEFPAVRVRGRLIVPARVIDEMVAAALDENRRVDAAEWARKSAERGTAEMGPGGIAARRGPASEVPGEDASTRVQGRGWTA